MKVKSPNMPYIEFLEPGDLKVEKEFITGFEGSFEEFCSFFSKLIQTKLDKVYREKIEFIDHYDSFVQYSYHYLYSDILNCSIKTLIKEIDLFKKEKNSDKDVYEEFTNELLKLSFHKELYSKYPVLYQLIEKRIENYFHLIENLLDRFIEDLDTLQKKFIFNQKKISNIVLSKGDFHNGGTTTVFLNVGNIKIVYKPKNLENDLIMQDIVDFVNKQPEQKFKLKHVSTINRNDYGWQILIEKQECNNEDEVNNYYYRIGSYLSVFLLLGTDDLHNENILSCGEYPFFIDLETLVKPEKDLGVFTGAMKSFLNEINNSVLSTMLLPTNAVYSATDCDIGGISSFNDESSTLVKSFQLIKKGTDKIALANREVFMGSGDNHLYLDKTIIYPNNYAKQIVEGFKDTFEILRSNIDALVEIIRKRTVYSRTVIRPTFIYGLLLDASKHPNYLSDEKNQNKLFEFLNTSEQKKTTLHSIQEIRALKSGDVPHFHQEGKDLICNGEFVIKDYFEYSLDEIIDKRIKRFCDTNLDREVSYINLSLSTLKNLNGVKGVNMFKDIKSINKLTPLIKNQYILDCIEAKLSNNLLWSELNDSCTWITTTQLDTKYSLNGANGFLYESGGVLMFYLMLYKQTSESKYLLFAESIFKGLKETGMLKQKLNESAFIGSASHLYLASNLYRITQKEEYRVFVLDSLNYLLEIEFKNLDYLGGVSGLLVLLNNIYKKIPLQEIQLVANKAVNFMEKNVDKFQPETGIAHGYSGLILGYLAANELLKEKKFLEKACDMASLENQYFKEDLSNWLDLRDNKSVNFGWCRGSSGIAFARAKLKTVLSKNEEMYLECSLKTTFDAIDSNKFNDDSLCHGLFGTIDNLIDIKNILGNLEYNLPELVNEKLNSLISNGFRFGVSSLIESDNFFVGYTGLGYVLLRIDNNELPSLPHLEIF